MRLAPAPISIYKAPLVSWRTRRASSPACIAFFQDAKSVDTMARASFGCRIGDRTNSMATMWFTCTSSFDGIGYMWGSHPGDKRPRQVLSFADGTRQSNPIVSFRTLRGNTLPFMVCVSQSVRSEVNMMKLRFSNFLIDRACLHHSVIELACGTIEN